MGFWSTLASIGTSLIPGIGPILAPIVGGAVGALTSGGGGGTAGNTGTNAAALKSIDLGKASDSPDVQSGMDSLTPAKNYFQTALGGSQEQAEQMLGPQVSTVLDQYDNAAKTASELGPRGGGRTAILAEAPFKKAAAYGTALSGVQTGAAKNLADIGINQADIGLKENSQANQFKVSQADLNSKQNALQFQGAQAQSKQYSDIGSGIGSILTRIIAGNKTNKSSTPSIFGGGGSGGGPDWTGTGFSGQE